MATAAKKKADGRFLGWQKTPIQVASFGRSTKSGSKNIKFPLKHSTGEVLETQANTYLIDASQAPIGRVASVIAVLMMGKHKSTFTPSAGSGDHVIVINADKAYFTSNKDEKKVYYWHTGYMGGLKSETARQALEKHPEKVIYDAVEGMLPKNRLSRYQMSTLKIYKGADHPHKAQNPKSIKIDRAGLKKLGV